MDNPLKKIFSNISFFNSKTNNSAVGIDIGSSSIKIVEIKRNTTSKPAFTKLDVVFRIDLIDFFMGVLIK